MLSLRCCKWIYPSIYVQLTVGYLELRTESITSSCKLLYLTCFPRENTLKKWKLSFQNKKMTYFIGLPTRNQRSLSRVQLCDPTDCSLPGSSIHGIFQARILEWVTISFSRRSSQPRDWTQVSHMVGRRFTIWATREVFIGLQWEFMYLFIATSCDTSDLNSPTRIRTWIPYIKSIESSPRGCQGSCMNWAFLCLCFVRNKESSQVE